MTQRVWFCALPGADLLSIVGPWEVFARANARAGHAAYQLVMITPGGGAVVSRFGLKLAAGVSLESASEAGSPHTLLVSGSSADRRLPAAERRLAAWLREHHGQIRRIVSVCTGAFVLAAAGVLEGKRATTHAELIAELQQRFPGTHTVNGGIYVQDGKVWTAAGASAGIDLSLALVEEDLGRRMATAIAQDMLVFVRRSGKQEQVGPALYRQSMLPAPSDDIRAFVIKRLDQEITVEMLAREVGMSSRTLTRWFRRELGTTPANYIRTTRIEEARNLLVETDLPLKAVALRSGLGDASSLWRAFTAHLGITPDAYRKKSRPGMS